MPPKSTKESYSLYPDLHDEVSESLAEDGLTFQFFKTDDARSSIKSWDTNVMGKFKCHNPKCKNDGWSSKRIAITIRMYNGRKYNARIYHQRCIKCKLISRPELNHSYADRVAYRLKKWSGIQQDVPTYAGRSERPHEVKLCEGCRLGRCSQA